MRFSPVWLVRAREINRVNGLSSLLCRFRGAVSHSNKASALILLEDGIHSVPSLERRKEKDERVFGLTTKSNSSGHRHLFKGKRTDRPALAPPHLLIYSPHSCSFRRRSEQTPSLPETGRGRLVGLSPDGIFPHIRDAGRRPRWAAACRKLHVACHFLGAV